MRPPKPLRVRSSAIMTAAQVAERRCLGSREPALNIVAGYGKCPACNQPFRVDKNGKIVRHINPLIPRALTPDDDHV